MWNKVEVISILNTFSISKEIIVVFKKQIGNEVQWIYCKYSYVQIYLNIGTSFFRSKYKTIIIYLIEALTAAEVNTFREW